jgi:lipopolysaccharide export system protein LptA
MKLFDLRTEIRHWKLILCLSLMLPMLLCAGGAGAVERRGSRLLDENQPIQIVSDRLDAFSEKKLVVFSGNAVATQGGRIIKADRLFLYYRNRSQDKSVAEAAAKLGQTGDLDRVEAKGRVTITEGIRTVTGSDAIYYQDTQKIIMTGNAVMREGENIIRGDKIVVLLNENRGIVESETNKRVTATIYPKDSREKKK